MLQPVGTRVIALLKADEKTVYSFGEGTYAGEQPCELMGGLENPKIELDSGEVVWGCECWWGPVAEVEAKYAGREVVVLKRADLELLELREGVKETLKAVELVFASKLPRPEIDEFKSRLLDIVVTAYRGFGEQGH